MLLKNAILSAGALLLAGAAANAQSSTATGSQSAGPSSQGTCTLAATDAWLCSNGAYCTWTGTAFSCLGGSGEVVAPTGPPGRTCISHLDHFDCTDSAGVESLCELEGDVWVCETSGGGGEGGSSSASTCVVHGGHTHGDCSNACDNLDLGEWNQNLHIVSVFVLLVAGGLGVYLPIGLSHMMRSPGFGWAFFVAKHFGTGVILSVSFIHLLYHAFIMFGNDCLGELAFEPAAPAISLAALIIIFAFDFVFMRMINARARRSTAAATESSSSSEDGISPSDQEKHVGPALPDNHTHSHQHHHATDVDFSSPQAHMDVTILEAALCFHSIMIGVTLGVSGGSQWTPLFIAIVFHQLFEGLALGTRIGQLQFTAGKNWHKYVMGAVFALITPIGIAIGMGVHGSYNANSSEALLSIGILDSISAGLLLYSGIVEMLVHDFMHGELASARPSRVIFAFLSLLAGALCMSVLGVWA